MKVRCIEMRQGLTREKEDGSELKNLKVLKKKKEVTGLRIIRGQRK